MSDATSEAPIRTSVATTLDDVLSIIACSDDYGHTNEVVQHFFTGLLGGWIGDDEIEAYASSFLTPEMLAKGYGEEDAEDRRERLQEFRRRWCGGRSAPITGEV
jgi:hypothetical protein